MIRHIEGWILDLYPKDGRMVVWLKTPDGQSIRLADSWQQFLFVAGDYSGLVNLAKQLNVEGMSFEKKFISPEDQGPSIVLKVPVPKNRNAEYLAEKILVYGRYSRYDLYNVDVKSSQLYMYEKDICPFGYVKATVNDSNICWKLDDNLDSIDYDIPPLREVDLSVKVQQRSRLPNLDSPIESITIKSKDEVYHINSHDEQQNLLNFADTMNAVDPDIIYTTNGDNFLFPYLDHRATVNGVTDRLILSRESTPLGAPHRKGQTYTSYGRVHYRPTPTRLLGRIHIDRETSILYRDCGLHGIIEVARLCRAPVHSVSNTTIGTSMTSAQLYEANRLGILIPWMKKNAEELKTARELLIADRGGFYYEPIAGLHESVGELDFTSLYPMIMLNKNLSGETVRCKCCPDSKNRVPELDYNICEKHIGIVPRSLKPLLEKRRKYKELKQTTTDPVLRSIYEMRQVALKWILVCAFGYLGFKNARFGRIDAHIATCAFARKILKDAVHLAESRGFRLIHGIVDSLWLKKEGATEQDYLRLRAEIEAATGFPLSFEGIYRWIVFLSSKTNKSIPVLNRYYGVFRNGKIKDRGIATRRHDTPLIIDKCIREVIHALSEAENTEEFQGKLKLTHKIIQKYIGLLRSGEIPLEELTIRKRLSKNPNEYKNMVLQAIAANQLAKEGAIPNAGECVSYIVTKGQGKIPKSRVLAFELCEKSNSYDAGSYIDLLLSSVETILMPFQNHRSSTDSLRRHVA